jgi:hypothetical protein
MTFATACGKSSTSSSTSSVAISGTLAASALVDYLSDNGASYATDFSVYTMRCVTLSGDLKAGSGTCAADGSFSLTIDGATGVAVGCFLMQGTSLIATMEISGSDTGLSGSSSTESSVVPSGGSLVLGTITFDKANGKLTVPKAQISGVGSAAGTFTDVTGTWKVDTCKTFNNTTGVFEACPAKGGNGGGGVPDFVYLHQLAATDGAGKAHTGLSVWESPTAFSDCGSVEGIQLPAGWTATTAGMTTAISFVGLDLAGAKVQWADGNGRTVCGIPATAGTTLCSGLIAASGNWGTPPGGVAFGNSACRAMCYANSVFNSAQTGCLQEFTVDWSKTQGPQAGSLVCDAGGCYDSGGSTSNYNYVKPSKQPRGRFIANEMIVAGNIGSLTDHKRREEYPCIKNADGMGCTSVHCPINENILFTITESSATTATIDVLQKRGLDPTLDAATAAKCLTDDSNNYVPHEVGEEHILLTATKQ